jgi:hypothetical protein
MTQELKVYFAPYVFGGIKAKGETEVYLKEDDDKYIAELKEKIKE